MSLSGVVYELTPTGLTPIAAAVVDCELCGEETHTFATADDNGFYNFSGDLARGGGVWVVPGVPTPIAVGYYNKDYEDPPGLPAMGHGAWLERGADRRGHEIRHRTGTTRSSHSVISPLRQRRGAYQLDRLGECGIKRIRTRTGCYVGHHTAIFRRKCRPSLYRAKTQGRLGCPEFRRHLQRSTCSFVRGAARQEQSPGG